MLEQGSTIPSRLKAEPPTPARLRILLASPRGFCAGVTRAIDAVRAALLKHGPPVYVRRPIVHNMAVVRSLEAEGAVFVRELAEVPEGAVVLLSAHGSAPAIAEEARSRKLVAYDAVCPLVAKVHREVDRHRRDGRKIILIGHLGHPEIEGTLGRVASGGAYVINSVEAVANLPLERDQPAAWAVQTTYSVDDAQAIVEALRAQFSDLVGPASSDICYATTNRQMAIRAIAEQADAIIVVGEQFSSNASRLAEVAKVHCENVQLVAGAQEIDWSLLPLHGTVGISAAASTPEWSIDEVIAAISGRYVVSLEEIGSSPERAAFRPLELT